MKRVLFFIVPSWKCSVLTSWFFIIRKMMKEISNFYTDWSHKWNIYWGEGPLLLWPMNCVKAVRRRGVVCPGVWVKCPAQHYRFQMHTHWKPASNHTVELRVLDTHHSSQPDRWTGSYKGIFPFKGSVLWITSLARALFLKKQGTIEKKSSQYNRKF